jgi:purine nucleosidase
VTDRAPLPVVIDCDTGVDDAMALFYGLLSPGIDVVAIGCVWGNIPVEVATTNTLRIVEMMGRPDIPVANGLGKPLLGPTWDLAHGVHGVDGQGNTNLPPPTLKPSGETAAAQIVRLAHERPGELTLVPVGPMTNVATALAMDPTIAKLYKQVVLMGGNFLAPGNISKWGEANIYHDPEAAQMVFEAEWPVVAVGLDVTLKVLLDQPKLDRLAASGTTAGVHLSKITKFYLDRYESRRGRRECAMHDALALGIAEDPSLIRLSRKARVDVECRGEHTRGMTVADLRAWAPSEGANTEVVLEVDGERFVERWMNLIAGGR